MKIETETKQTEVRRPATAPGAVSLRRGIINKPTASSMLKVNVDGQALRPSTAGGNVGNGEAAAEQVDTNALVSSTLDPLE